MQAAVSAEGLTAAWRQLTEGLGPFKQLELVKAFQEQGADAFVYAARFQRGAIEVSAAVDPATLRVVGFFLKPMALDLPALPTPAPPGYVTAASFSNFEVTVGRAPFELGGTLAVPAGTGPFAAVVLVHGSGPSDRDETVGANKPFKDIAEGLASSGVVVLRYDKRTLVHGREYVGKPISFDEEIIDDAVAGVALLRARPEVDPARVYVVGHSLGALVAPVIATRAKKVAGVALLAPPSRKPWEIIPQQLRYLGAPPERIAEVEAAFAPLRAGRASGGPVLNAPASYWLEWARTDGIGAARRLKAPVLVLRGERDYQVIEADFAGWKKGLQGVKGARLVELPGLNHLFIAGEGPSTSDEYAVPGHVAPEVIAELVRFVR
jgi:hypothetical protein